MTSLSGREETRGTWVWVGFAENGQIVEPRLPLESGKIVSTALKDGAVLRGEIKKETGG